MLFNSQISSQSERSVSVQNTIWIILLRLRFFQYQRNYFLKNKEKISEAGF